MASQPSESTKDKTLVEEEIELRVHDIQGGQISVAEEHSDDTVPASSFSLPFSAIWNKSSYGQSTPALYDRMSKNSAAYHPPTNYIPGAEDWTQMIDHDHGGIVSYMFVDPIRGPLEATSTNYTYIDDTDYHGKFGRNWVDISCMQDGLSNDGGCGTAGPEDPSLLFRRIYHRSFATKVAGEQTSGSVEAQNYPDALIPYRRANSEDQLSSCTICCSHSPPCVPTLSVVANADGTDSVSAGPPAQPVGCLNSEIAMYGITRQLSGGSEEMLAFVGGAGGFTDFSTSFGVQTSYRAFSIGKDGTRSAKTGAVTVTPNDTAAPAAPSITATPVANGAYVDSDPCLTVGANDIRSMNVYISTTSGGPYTKVNISPISASNPIHFAVSGLTNGVTYYLVAKYSDYVGNFSAYSNQVAVTPSP